MVERYWTDALLRDARERRDAGENIKDIATSHGRDWTALYKQLKKLDGELGVSRKWGAWAATYTAPTDPADLGYLAGIIDGEGSVMLTGQGRWLVKVGMTDEPVIRWLASFGGTFNHSRPSSGGRKDVYTWMLSRRRDLPTFLEAILPYLKVKQDRARLAIEWAQSGGPVPPRPR